MRETKLVRIVGAFLLAVFSGAFCRAAAHGEPKLMAQAAVLMELHSGRILWGKNAEGRLAPASTTKILTALVALERSGLNETVTVSERATVVDGTRVHLRAGEKLPMEELLYALLVDSGNDAAVAIAEHVGSSIDGFVKLMNEKAREIGALNSRFLNPSGLPEKGHYTTANDLALIARAALRKAAFREVVGTRNHSWRSREWEGTLINQNKLLGEYEGAIGVKTGYSREAGQCVVAAAQRGEETYLAVVSKSSGKAIWEDAVNLLDYGFDNYARVELAERGDTLLTSVVNGEEVSLAAAAPVVHLVAQSEPVTSRLNIVLDELGPPISKGDKLGQVVFLDGSEEIASIDLVATVEVPERPPLLPLLTWVGWGLVGVLWVRLRLARRRQRYIFARRDRRIKL